MAKATASEVLVLFNVPLDVTPFIKSGSAQYRLKSYISTIPLEPLIQPQVRMEKGDWLSFNDSKPLQRVRVCDRLYAFLRKNIVFTTVDLLTFPVYSPS